MMCLSSGRPFVHAVFYGVFFMHLYKHSSRLKDMLDTCTNACTNGLPDDEHKMFESCRRHQELN